ncbi:MAG: GNAT family N-acetyltransferase [Rhodanobacteraceae bacterium]
MNAERSPPGFRESPSESLRFGLRVFRAEADAIDAQALAEAIDREHVDVAILRVPAQALGSLQTLRVRGLAPIVADTIVRYEASLPLAPLVLDESVTLRPATARDAQYLETLAREIFDGYVSHYHANPLFPAAKIADGYGEWAASHVSAGRAGAIAWLVESHGEVAGFSCCRIDEATGLAIGVLNGVLPAFRGRGVYRGMLRRMLSDFGERGLARFAISTQVQNFAVQRIWVAEGLALTRTDNTVHINSMLGRALPKDSSVRSEGIK